MQRVRVIRFYIEQLAIVGRRFFQTAGAMESECGSKSVIRHPRHFRDFC